MLLSGVGPDAPASADTSDVLYCTKPQLAGTAPQTWQSVGEAAAFGAFSAARRAGQAGPLLALQTAGPSHTSAGQEEVPPGHRIAAAPVH